VTTTTKPTAAAEPQAKWNQAAAKDKLSLNCSRATPLPKHNPNYRQGQESSHVYHQALATSKTSKARKLSHNITEAEQQLKLISRAQPLPTVDKSQTSLATIKPCHSWSQVNPRQTTVQANLSHSRSQATAGSKLRLHLSCTTTEDWSTLTQDASDQAKPSPYPSHSRRPA